MTAAILKRLAPVAALTIAAALSGCEGNDMQINGSDGVPLTDIVMSGEAPSELVLSSGDTVILTDGDTFALKVEGGDTDTLRFVRDEKMIGIARINGWNGDQTATIRITMPPPREVTIAGSGTVQAQSLAATSMLTIGGAGTVTFAKAAADRLEINIGGSGTVKGAGTAKQLEVNIGGSGDVDLSKLKADNAEVSIGGSGDVAFASDGAVEANIAGAGDVKVAGNAKCTINAFGSGTLTCSPTTSGVIAALPVPAETPETSGVPIATKAPTTPPAAKPAE